MIPTQKSDPRWTKFLASMGLVKVNNLSTKMLISRLKLLGWEGSEAKKQEAIAAAYEFFTKNAATVQDDIKVIFG